MEPKLANVRAVLIADQPNSFVTRRLNEANLVFGGIPGDRHFGRTKASDSRQKAFYSKGTEILNRRQISIVSVEECEEIALELGVETVKPEWLGANFLIEGLAHLTSLPAGSRILFPSGAGLVVENENLPCVLPGKVLETIYENEEKLASRFVKGANKRRGLVCSVERPGHVTPSDQIKVFINSKDRPLQ